MASNKKVLKGITIGDLHLDKLIKLIPNINAIIIGFCRKLLQQAVDEEYDVAVFLGDIFNYSTPSEESQRLLLELLIEFQDKIELRLIEGNHGYRRAGKGSLSSLALLEEFKLIKAWLITEPRLEIIKGVPLLYMPHPYTSVSQLSSKPAVMWDLCVESELVEPKEYEQVESLGADLDGLLYNTIAFAHFTRAGSIRDNGTKGKDGVKYKKGCDASYYINGHLHTPQELNETKYPGTFYQTSFGEGSEKGYGRFVAKMKDSGEIQFKYEFVPVDPPIKLVNIIAWEERQLPKKIERDTWYKITPMGGFTVPEKWVNHKHITVSTPIGSSASMHLKDVGEDATDESVEFDLRSNSLEYLENLGLTEKQLKLAEKLLTTAADELGLEL